MDNSLLSQRVPSLTAVEAELLRRDFREYIRAAWPIVEPKTFTPGWHIDAIAEHLVWLAFGEINQLMINIAPRHSKSLISSVLFPTWIWTQPDLAGMQLLSASYDMDLSIRDTMKSRRLIQSNWYQERFGDVFQFNIDENAKSRYSNDRGGYRIATSTSGGTGEGGDLTSIDDPHNLKEIYSDAKRQGVIDWYKDVFKSRQNDPNNPKRLIIMQRGHDADLAGYLWENEKEDWEWLILPMHYDHARKSQTYIDGKKVFKDPRKKEGELLCPERMDEKAVASMKRTMTKRDYSAQYEQDPEAGGGLILKRKDWRKWPHDQPPRVLELVSFYDTAFGEKQEADYSARTTWGVFEFSETGDERHMEPHIILLNSWWDQVSYPDLKKQVKDTNKKFNEDYLVIEAKASGLDLINDLRRASARYPIKAFKVRQDKVSRAHMASHALEKGNVWYLDREKNNKVISLCAKFPAVDIKDPVDTVTMALIWFKKRHMIEDIEETEDRDEYTDQAPKRTRSIY